MLLPNFQTIWRHIPEDTNTHTLLSAVVGYVSGQKNQLTLQIFNTHLVYFVKYLILNFSSIYCPAGNHDNTVDTVIG
jgi:hypothetical protein